MLRAIWNRLIHPNTGRFGRRHPAAPRCRTRRATRLALESLEDRWTPATVFVTNSSDNLLPGSLR
jgi:hypothetical protein